MDKIRSLMINAGISEEAASKICESLESYKTEIKRTLEEQYAEKIGKAKQICESEVEAYKQELARRLQIFCEAKSNYVESTVAKQAANKESEAVAKLNKIYAMLEGIELEGQPNGELRAKVEQLTKKAASLEESRKQAFIKANRQVEIAEKVLKRNRDLERQLNEHLKNTTVVTESAPAAKAPTPTSKPKRLDEQRSKSKPVSTRRTLVENQTRTPSKPEKAEPQPYSPAAIAAAME